MIKGDVWLSLFMKEVGSLRFIAEAILLLPSDKDTHLELMSFGSGQWTGYKKIVGGGQQNTYLRT